MRRLGAGTELMLAGALFLSACQSEPAETAPEPSEADTPRSIFQEDVVQQNEPDPDTPLPPLRTILAFADGTMDLTQAVRAELMTVANSPQVAAGGPIVLRGHSDSAGSDEENLASSRARAEAVRDFLVNAGVAEDRIEIIAFGEQNPREPNALPDGSPNETGRAANRRVHLTVQTGVQPPRQPTLIESLTENTAADDQADAPATPARTETGQR